MRCWTAGAGVLGALIWALAAGIAAADESALVIRFEASAHKLPAQAICDALAQQLKRPVRQDPAESEELLSIAVDEEGRITLRYRSASGELVRTLLAPSNPQQLVALVSLASENLVRDQSGEFMRTHPQPEAPAEPGVEHAPEPALRAGTEPAPDPKPAPLAPGRAPGTEDFFAVQAPPPPKPPQVWYGWQTLTADGLSFALFLGAQRTQGQTRIDLYGVSAVSFLFASPVIHFTQRRAHLAALSLGLRPGALLLGAYVGVISAAASGNGCQPQPAYPGAPQAQCGSTFLLTPIAVAGAVVTGVDALLAYTDARRPSKATQRAQLDVLANVWVDRDSLRVRVGASF